ncbi:hypothetical protein HGA11_05635 [Mycolicibacterium septicum DSM 44393]|uniref:Uncharacterized protein n=1 Tax=Mycolicibacterium septicum DSM 44393 TaxID=1341646 RepID=A0A7X6MP25_9MYCO|nr:hypothetical protein [Mycolicibacterium septicum]NKZ10452.1 hypothetical protein [Mycolicibacterium septicum DSM 44393]
MLAPSLLDHWKSNQTVNRCPPMLTVGAMSFTREISMVAFSRVADVLAVVTEATTQRRSMVLQKLRG